MLYLMPQAGSDEIELVMPSPKNVPNAYQAELPSFAQ